MDKGQNWWTYIGKGWGYIRGGHILGWKNASICNLLILLFFLSSIKHVFWHFSFRSRCEICSKLTIETLKYVKLMIKLKIKTQSTWLWPLWCQLWTHFTSCYSLSQLIASWGCCLLFWHFVSAGINLSKVYRGGCIYGGGRGLYSVY